MNAAVRDFSALLAMRGVVKRFGGVQALHGVDFDLYRGRDPCAARRERRWQIDADEHPVGRDRARRAAKCAIDGRPMRFANPRAAQAGGIATIFQELDLVPGLDITANLFLGRELTRAGVLDRAAMRARCADPP